MLLTVIGKIALPALASGAILTAFHFGGSAVQSFGLAALDSTRNVLTYALGIAGFLSLAVLAQRILRYVVFDGLILKATGTPVPKLLSQISGLVIFLIATSACAGIVFEQDLTVLWAASGVAGLVLGMALRELLQDIFAGIALNIDRAVRIGDFVQLHKAGDAAISGQLLEISWRTARIKDFSGDEVIIPNSRFSASTITNFSKPEPVSWRAASVTLDARVPPERAMRILEAAALDAATGLAGIAEATAPVVEVKAIRPEGVEYAVCFKAEFRHLASLRPLVLRRALDHLAQAGLAPAIPRQEAATAEDAAPPRRLEGPEAGRLAALLGAAPLFAGLDPAALRHLAEGARLRAEPAGRTIVQAGEVGSGLFLVVEGLLAATAERRAGPATATLLRPGALFDPGVALLGRAHPLTVQSRSRALLCEIEHAVLLRLFQSHAAAFAIIGRNLAMLPPPRAGAELGEEAEVLRQMRFLFPGGRAAPPRAAVA